MTLKHNSNSIKKTDLRFRFRIGPQIGIIRGTRDLQIRNSTFPNSKNSYFQNEAKCKTFLVEMSFTCKLREFKKCDEGFFYSWEAKNSVKLNESHCTLYVDLVSFKTQME